MNSEILSTRMPPDEIRRFEAAALVVGTTRAELARTAIRRITEETFRATAKIEREDTR